MNDAQRAAGRASLRPGVPDDRNRDYLPVSLRAGGIVVNESGNNSQPYPVRLEEVHGVIADGVVDTWYIYVPESYDPAVAAPLVVSLHGGLMTGWGQAVYSSWVNVADREGFIVVFPTAGSRGMWTIDIAPDRLEQATTPNPVNGMYLNRPPALAEDNHDLRFLRGLIENVAAGYSIDRGRIFMHGMSMGDIMTSQFARHFGDVLAGAAGSAGLTDPDLLFHDGRPINRAGALPVWQSRLDRDHEPTMFGDDTRGVIEANREYWLQVDGVTDPPAIAIDGVDNFAFYRGDHADVVFRDVAGRDHGQTFDDAELVWDYLFSGVSRRGDGVVEISASLLEREGDRFGLAIAEGRARAWLTGERVALTVAPFAWSSLRYHGMEGDAVVRDTYLYAPLTFVARAFHAEATAEEAGAVVSLTLDDGRTLQFARGNVGCILDGRVTAMPAEAVLRDGELCIPLKWFAERVMQLRASSCAGVLYVTDHFSVLSGNMARLLDRLLV